MAENRLLPAMACHPITKTTIDRTPPTNRKRQGSHQASHAPNIEQYPNVLEAINRGLALAGRHS